MFFAAHCAAALLGKPFWKVIFVLPPVLQLSGEHFFEIAGLARCAAASHFQRLFWKKRHAPFQKATLLFEVPSRRLVGSLPMPAALPGI